MEETEVIINIFFGISFALIIAALSYIFSRKFKTIPFPVFLVIIGILLSPFTIEPLQLIKLTPSSVLFIYLPILLFESAYKFDFREFRKVISPAFLLATVGLAIAISFVAVTVKLLLSVSWADAFLFGAIISSTDPIAILTIFKQVGVPKKLQLLIDAESFLNDATSVIVFRFLLGLVAAGNYTLAGSDLFFNSLNFIYVLFGGVFVGAIVAYIFANAIASIKNASSVEIALTIILPILVFILSEHYLMVSGIIAVLSAGLVIGNYGMTKISPETVGTMDSTWEFMTFIVTSLVFLLIGYEMNLQAFIDNFPVMLLVTASLLLGRAVGVYLIGGVHNIFSDRNKIPIKWLHIVNWGGLRGVLPLVVALSLPESYQYREIFIQLVLFAIYFTLVINGITMEFIINVLGISKPNAANKFEIKISELIILQKLGKHIEKLRKIGEIGEKTYNKHKQEIGTILEHNQQQLKELLNSNPEEYDSEIEKVLKRYCLQVEKSSYKRLFDKEVLTETVYNRLRFCIDQQKDSISEGGEQFSEQENSFYKQIFERKDDWLRAAVMRLLPFENEKKLIEESYLYHKARLLANESVLDDLQDFKIVILNEKTEAVIADLVETYRKLMEKNQNILDRIVTEYRDISFAVDEKCFYCETQSLIGGIISEYGEDGRISKKALKNLELKL